MNLQQFNDSENFKKIPDFGFSASFGGFKFELDFLQASIVFSLSP